MVQRYQKRTSSELDTEFKSAETYGAVKVGQTQIFWRRFLLWYRIAAKEVVRAYRQVEEVSSATSCCETDFSIQRLILVDQDGQETTVTIGDSLFRGEPEQLMLTLARLHPHIQQGRP